MTLTISRVQTAKQAPVSILSMNIDLRDAGCQVWGPGQLFAFSACDGQTDYQRGLILRSRGDGLQILAPGRLDLQLPPASSIEAFGCDWLVAASNAGPLRMAFVDACTILLDGPWSLGTPADALQVSRHDQTMLISSHTTVWPSADLDSTIAARQAWATSRIAALPDHPLVPKIVQVMKGQLCSPTGAFTRRWSTPDRWPHKDCWLWDTAFHAVGWRHIDPACAREQISALLDRQDAQGFIAHCYAPTTTSDITQPPVLAWAASEVLAIEQDEAWLADVYPRLAAFMDWLLQARGREGTPLLHWLTVDDEHCPCPESGWDNSIRFSGCAHLDAVDLSAFASRDCAVLASFAERLGIIADARRWRQRHQAINRAIQEDLWHDDLGLFCDRDIDGGNLRPLRTPAGLLPLLCGAASAAQIACLVSQIEDPDCFDSPMPIPSVAMADQVGLPQVDDMWCGPVWININHQLIRGLQASGAADQAQRLRAATLAGIEHWYHQTGALFEYYDCRNQTAPNRLPRKGPNDPESAYHMAIHDFGWTATLALDLICT